MATDFKARAHLRPKWRLLWRGFEACLGCTRMTGMSNELESQQNRGVVLEEARPEVGLPPMYRVVLLNDDFTPMEFVVEVLQMFFGMDHDRATQVMLHVHTRGKGVCGVFTFEIAETKVVQVNEYSRQHEHPLKCTLERA